MGTVPRSNETLLSKIDIPPSRGILYPAEIIIPYMPLISPDIGYDNYPIAITISPYMNDCFIAQPELLPPSGG
jgi:hypothetical protein